jgi:hypothetical protein
MFAMDEIVQQSLKVTFENGLQAAQYEVASCGGINEKAEV